MVVTADPAAVRAPDGGGGMDDGASADVGGAWWRSAASFSAERRHEHMQEPTCWWSAGGNGVGVMTRRRALPLARKGTEESGGRSARGAPPFLRDA